MTCVNKTTPVLVMGDTFPSGAYVLRMQVRTDLTLVFGRFQGGQPIAVPAGTYAYAGSAMGVRGATTLGKRLMRHATRSGDQPPHTIRAKLLEAFAAAGLGGDDLLPKSAKTLFWNVDFLLDEMAVDITGVIAIRSQQRLENPIAHWLENQPRVTILAKGLGANDSPGSTHLLRVDQTVAWWADLPQRLRQFGEA